MVQSASTRMIGRDLPAAEGGRLTVKAKEDIPGVGYLHINKKASHKGARTFKYGGG